MHHILAIFMSSLLFSMVAQTLSSMEMRKIRRKEGVRDDSSLIKVLDLTIITLVSVLMQVGALGYGQDIMAIAGMFGAFLAASAWSDAKTGWVPDVSIIPALIFGLLSAWSWHTGSAPDILRGLWISLAALALFGVLVFSYLHFSWVRITPPDAIFVVLILVTPADLTQMIIVLCALILSIILVKSRPDLVRSLIPEDERTRLTSQMEEALGVDSGHMEKNGWFPVGPIAMFCVLTGYCANALI